MATTIQQAFTGLKSNLEISNFQESTVSARQQAVRAAIQDGLEVTNDFLTGSYRRQTMIAPLVQADVDICVIFPTRYYHHYNGQNGGPAGLLDLTRRTLLKRYARTPSISRNGQAVTIQFNDFVVDVVAGFQRQGGGYLIANSVTNSWLSTDPTKHVEIVSTANKVHAGSFIPLVKMLKGWNKSIGSFFGSFHVEVMALQILQNVIISDFPSGVRFFFDKAREHVKMKNPDPAGYGDDVGKYLNTPAKIETAVSHITTAHNRALRAEELGASGRVVEAINEWRKIFPDYFPAFG